MVSLTKDASEIHSHENVGAYVNKLFKMYLDPDWTLGHNFDSSVRRGTLVIHHNEKHMVIPYELPVRLDVLRYMVSEQCESERMKSEQV
jgi:hypothetical protein